MRAKLLTALLLACLAAPVCAAPESIGLVIALKGTATATAADGQARALQMKSPLFANDTVITKAASRLQIMFEDDSVVAQGENSRMTIDAYVYDPDRKEEGNCALKLVTGLFRVVTGAITELNPDRFKAQTKLATVGIRGCELGFSLQDALEEIYILQLPPEKRIVIGKTLTEGELKHERRRELERALTIAKAGVAIQVREGVALTERAIAVNEARQFIRGATLVPAGEGDKAPGDDGDGKAPDGTGASARDARDKVDNAVAERNETQRQADEGDVRDRGITSDPGAPTASAPQEPPPDITVTEAKLVLNGGTPFEDWEWAIWEDGRTAFYANRATEAAFLTAAEYQDIANGATRYDLTGSGTAGALVKHGGVNKTLQGSCSLNVRVGASSMADWDGTFNMSNSDGDSLSFGVRGPIAADGTLNGTLDETTSSYYLQVGGTMFDIGTVTGQDVNGRLIHYPPSGAGSISAASGRVLVDHGGDASVHSAFGATLRPSP
jgi:hypothetical protein